MLTRHNIPNENMRKQNLSDVNLDLIIWRPSRNQSVVVYNAAGSLTSK